jgi:hypothetical protein
MDTKAAEAVNEKSGATQAVPAQHPPPPAPATAHDNSTTHGNTGTTQAAATQLNPSNSKSQPHVINPTFFGDLAGRDGQKYKTLRDRITTAYKWHTAQYWFVASLSNALLFIQILVAASLTALGAFNDHRARTATIFLGGANTIIAGLLTYFKTRNQPNRVRQFRNALAKIVDQLDDAETNFRDPNYDGNVETVLQQIRDAYSQARHDAQLNYPDLWVTGTARNPDYTDPTDQDIRAGLAGPRRAQTWSSQPRRPISGSTIREIV